MRSLVLLLIAICLASSSSAAAAADLRSEPRALEVQRSSASSATTPPTPAGRACGSPGVPSASQATSGGCGGLNANTVRVVVPAALLRLPGARPTQAGAPARARRNRRRCRLHVQLTLFDWWDEYRDVEGSKRWARAVLAPYVGDPRDRVRRAQERDRPDRRAALLDARTGAVATRLPTGTDAGDRVGRRRDPERDLRALVAALPAARGPTSSMPTTSPAAARRPNTSSARCATSPRRRHCGSASSATRPPPTRAASGASRAPRPRQEAAQAHFLKLCFGALARLGLPAPGV